MRGEEVIKKFCSRCKNFYGTPNLYKEPCLSCFIRGVEVLSKTPKYFKPKDKKEDEKMNKVEAEKLEEVGKAMSPEEMTEIIKTIPTDILVNEVGRRLTKLDDLKGELNRLYGIASAGLRHGETKPKEVVNNI